ncbi:MAG: winged helix-turn-helix domain-containing protein, partial [Thalassotalea sp.]|nr:winged helix-turn-helix domain-containing protein [Thalassotalea sp.]
MTIYQCSDWTFSPDSQEIIYSDERSEQLPTRLNNCLLTLISSRGSTVSYDELLLKVWGTTHKDSSTISSVISEVRKLVGCGKDGKRVIITVPKRGYRFTQLVDVIEDEQLLQDIQRNQHSSTKPPLSIPQQDKHSKNLESVNTGADPLPKTTSSNRNQWVWLVIVALLAVFLLTFNLLEGSSNNITVKKTDVFSFSDYEVISHESGSEDEFDVSKDGHWLTYVNKAPNVTPSLIVQNLSTGRKQTLTANGEYYFGSPVFSFDAIQIVFHKQTAQHCEVWLADFSTFNLESSKTK